MLPVNIAPIFKAIFALKSIEISIFLIFVLFAIN